MPGVLN